MTKYFDNASLLRLLILTLALLASCAKRPPTQVAHGEDENFYSKDSLLGSGYGLLTSDDPFPEGSFSRVPFERHTPAAVDPDKANEVQKALIHKAGLDKAAQVVFYIDKNFIYLGEPGSEFFSALFPLEGHYNLRHQHNSEGKRNQYLEKAQEGSWHERPYVKVNLRDVDALLVAPDMDLIRVFKTSDLDGASYRFGDQIPGVTEAAMKLITAHHRLQQGDLLESYLFSGEAPSYVLYKALIANDGTKRMQELARYPVTYGNLDYLRHDLTKRPQDGRLVFVTDRQLSTADYKRVKISAIDNPVVPGHEALVAKKDLEGCLKVQDLPLEPLRTSIMNHLGPKANNGCFSFELGRSKAVVFWHPQGDAAKQLLLNLNLSHQTQVAYHFNDISAQHAEESSDPAIGWQQTTHVVFDTQSPSFPVDRAQLVEYAVDRQHLEGRDFIYSASIIASSVGDPRGFAGQQPFADRDRVRFRVDELEDFVTVYKVRDDFDPSNKELAILKFPVLERFDLTDRTRDGEALGQWSKDESRPWQERRYLRIDFSHSVVESIEDQLLAVSRLFGYYRSEHSEVISEPLAAGQENPYFFRDDATGFMSFVTRHTMAVNPLLVAQLEPTSLKIRHGFLPLIDRVNEDDSGYKPLVVDYFDQRMFGLFYRSKYVQDPMQQNLRENYIRLAQRFNIQGGRQIVYHLNEAFPDRYVPVVQEVMQAWNKAFEKATGRKDVMILNEVDRKKIGDLRFNMIVMFEQNIAAGLAGYGPALTHPDTGEVLSASSYIYEHALRQARVMAGIAFDHYVGGKGDDQLTAGSNSNVIAGVSTAAADGESGAFAWSTPSEVHNEMFSFFPGNPKPQIEIGQTDPGLKSAAEELLVQHIHFMKDQGGLIHSERSLKDAYGSMLQEVGLGLSEERWQELQALPRSLGGLADDPLTHLLRGKPDHTNGLLGKPARVFGLCGYQDGAIENMGTSAQAALKQRFPDTQGADREQLDAMKAAFLDEFTEAFLFDVLAHEVGHNLGLWHNFMGSSDEANYPPRYHELMKKGTSEAKQKAQLLRTSSIMDYNPSFEGQLYQLDLGNGQKSSQVGPYDEAAILFGYGEKLEVVDQMASGPLYQRVQGTLARAEVKKVLQGFWENGQSDNLVQRTYNALHLRPYRFCTNGEEQTSVMCTAFDSGSSPKEAMADAVSRYDEGYLLFSHSHGRKNFAPYDSRPVMRVISLSLKFLRDFSWAENILRGGGPQYREPIEQILGVDIEELEAAVRAGHGFLEKLIRTPEAGMSNRYVVDSQGNSAVFSVQIPAPLGKHLYPEYISESGIIEDTLRRGILLDKMQAWMGLLSRLRSAQNILGEPDLDFASYFSQEAYQSSVLQLLNESLIDSVTSPELSFRSVKVGTEDVFVYDPEGHVNVRVSTASHGLIRGAAKFFSALYIDSPNAPVEFGALTYFRHSQQVGFGSAPQELTLEFPDPLVAGLEWELIKPHQGLSLGASLARQLAGLGKEVESSRALLWQLDYMANGVDGIALEKLRQGELDLMIAQLDAQISGELDDDRRRSYRQTKEQLQSLQSRGLLVDGSMAFEVSRQLAILSAEAVEMQLLEEAMNAKAEELRPLIAGLSDENEGDAVSQTDQLDLLLSLLEARMEELATIESAAPEMEGIRAMTNMAHRLKDSLVSLPDEGDVTRGVAALAKLDHVAYQERQRIIGLLQTDGLIEERRRDLANNLCASLIKAMILDLHAALAERSEPQLLAFRDELQTFRQELDGWQNGVEPSVLAKFMFDLRRGLWENESALEAELPERFSSYLQLHSLVRGFVGQSSLATALIDWTNYNVDLSKNLMGQVHSLKGLHAILSPLGQLSP